MKDKTKNYNYKGYGTVFKTGKAEKRAVIDCWKDILNMKLTI